MKKRTKKINKSPVQKEQVNIKNIEIIKKQNREQLIKDWPKLI
jgi:hypothetical protein